MFCCRYRATTSRENSASKSSSARLTTADAVPRRSTGLLSADARVGARAAEGRTLRAPHTPGRRRGAARRARLRVRGACRHAGRPSAVAVEDAAARDAELVLRARLAVGTGAAAVGAGGAGARSAARAGQGDCDGEPAEHDDPSLSRGRGVGLYLALRERFRRPARCRKSTTAARRRAPCTTARSLPASHRSSWPTEGQGMAHLVESN